jgi:predicted ATPase/class 3 adenylate cyclase/DNA-binding CsgD family transcriptional regulator
MGTMEMYREYLAESSSVKESRLRAGAAASLPTGVVTFLLSDVEGSTRLWEKDEELAAAVITRHYELLDAAIVLHGGVRPVEQGEGDSVVGVFARPRDAVAAALDAQRAFADEPWPEDARLRIRIALHTGEAQLRGIDYYVGRAVIRCARLRAVAHGGQTVVSGATRDLVADELPDQATLLDLGSHRLKDLGRPERVWQLSHPELVNQFPALRSPDFVPNNLPIQLTSFVGRGAELADLRAAIETSRLVTLTGAGGCGKTRLALHAAADLAEHYPDGVWWVEFAAVTDPDRVAAGVARVLGLHEQEGRPPLDTIAEQLAGLRTLLVVDNAEHVLGACTDLVEGLLRATSDVRVVVTSREPLGVAGELTWRVPSLDEEAAARLFVERAAQVRPGFAPEGGEQQAVGQICRRLDGIPLAIELAAARIRMMPPGVILARLDDRFRLLTGGGRGVMPRQQTLEASLAWSYDLLDGQEQALLRRLSVFAGGSTLDAAEAVCADQLVDTYTVLDVLTRLVDKSLVQVDHEDVEGRYRLLETIRLFARDRLIEAKETDATRDRHRDFFLTLAERAEPELVTADGPVWLARLEREHDNLRGALEWCDATGAHASFLRLATALTLFFELRGHLAEGGRWFARALVRDDGPSVLRARALWGAAHVALYGNDNHTLAQRMPEALEMARVVGDDWAMARALTTAGYLQVLTEPEPARAALRQSIEFGRKIGDNWAVIDGVKMLTIACVVQDDYDGLEAPLAELRQLAERLGNQFFTAWYHCCLGWAGVHRGELEHARRSLETSLEYCNAVGDPACGGIAIAFLGEVEALTGEYDAAEARLRSFLQRAEATGGSLGVPWALNILAVLALGRGEPVTARALVEPLVEQLRVSRVDTWLAWGLAILGAARLAAGEEQAAEAHLEEARRIATALDNAWVLGQADHHLGRLARRAGDTRRAEALHHEALAHQARRRIRPGVIESLEALAALANDQESFAEAARLLGSASALRRSTGIIRWPSSQPDYEAEVSRARQALGDAAFDRALTEGEALTLDEAVAYASRARGERKRPSAGWGSLTPTEIEVVNLLAQGLTNPQIGERLFIGRGTVKTHLAHVFAKLGVTTRAELAAEATRRGR